MLNSTLQPFCDVVNGFTCCAAHEDAALREQFLKDMKDVASDPARAAVTKNMLCEVRFRVTQPNCCGEVPPDNQTLE